MTGNRRRARLAEVARNRSVPGSAAHPETGWAGGVVPAAECEPGPAPGGDWREHRGLTKRTSAPYRGYAKLSSAPHPGSAALPSLPLFPGEARATTGGLPGGEQLNDSGTHWRIELPVPRDTSWGEAESAVPGLLRRDADAPIAARFPLERGVFLDLETCGFAGTPLFLTGLLELRPSGPVVVQLLARTYAEEASVVEESRRILDKRDLVISFNGKSYDIPFLRDRATRHGMSLRVPEDHLDLLHAARRRWRTVLPDCRLPTLESRILGRPRVGDVPGSEAPERYHRFVKTGEAGPLVPVLQHNRRDLLTLVALLARLGPRNARPAGPRHVGT